jgi:hypothetical protein
VSRRRSSLLTVTYHDHRTRGDNLGALVTVLDNAPYGSNVEDAKVTIDKLGISKSLILLRI